MRHMMTQHGTAANVADVDSPHAAASISDRSIAQGCSEYNITVLIDQRDSIKALRAVHGRFYLATLPLALGIVGPGAIGATLLEQLRQQLQV